MTDNISFFVNGIDLTVELDVTKVLENVINASSEMTTLASLPLPTITKLKSPVTILDTNATFVFDAPNLVTDIAGNGTIVGTPADMANVVATNLPGTSSTLTVVSAGFTVTAANGVITIS